jgi:hypothetical protein
MSEMVRIDPPVFVKAISWAAAGVATRFVPKSTAVVLSVTAGPEADGGTGEGLGGGVCAELVGTTRPNDANDTKRIAEVLADVRVGTHLGADLIPPTLSPQREKIRRVMRSMQVSPQL